jgi:PmbA protein
VQVDSQSLLKKLAERDSGAEVFSGSFDSLEVKFSAGTVKNAVAREASGVAVRATKGGKQGFVGSRDTSETGMERLLTFVENSIAVGDETRYDLPGPQEPPCDPKSLESYDDAIAALAIEDLVATGNEAIAELKRRHPNVHVDATLRRSVGTTQLLNSKGVEISDRHTTYTVSMETNRTEDEDVLLDYAYAVGCSKEKVDALKIVEELSQRLDWAKETVALKPGSMPVIFTPQGSLVVWGPLLAGLNGKTVMLGTSPLRERVGDQIFDAAVTVTDDGLLPGGLSSAAFDDEGVPRQTRALVDKGVLKGFVHDLETSKALGTEPTGNGERGGVTGKPGPGFSNLLFGGGDTPSKDMIAGIKYGLLVHSVIGMGQGNTLPGAFSNPVDLAYLIEDGEVKGRVKDVSIAGNIYEVLKDNLGGLSSDVSVISGSVHLPWLQLNDMNVVGKAN